MADTVNMHPSHLNDTSYVAKNGSSTATNLSQDIDTALGDLVNSLVVVDVLTGVADTLETFGKDMLSTLACFATGLTVVGSGLEIASQAFKGLDATLAATLATVEKQLPYYTGYETHVTMPVIHVSTGPYTLTTTHITLHQPSPGFWDSVGNFFSSAWNDTTSFVGNHWQYIAAGGIIVVGVGLTAFTLGGSDAAAGAGAAALLAMAG